jgi:hypothetical protein
VKTHRLKIFYADTLKGTEGTLKKAFFDTYGNKWIKLHIVTNLSGQKICNIYPADVLEKI